MMHAWEAQARELTHLHATLAARRPALVVLAGAPGMGKSTLLETWGARATALGWEVAGSWRRLKVRPATDERGFRADVLARTCATDGAPRRRRALDPLLDELARRAPLLVLLDGYCPNPRFAEWFEEGFLPELSRCGAAVVVGVAARAPHGLGHRADQVVTLDRQESRRRDSNP